MWRRHENRCPVPPLVLAGVLLIAAWGRPAHGIIDPTFTPVQLVRQSRTIRVGIAAGGQGDRWTLKITETLKGEPADTGTEASLDLAGLDKDPAAAIRSLLASNGQAPVILFAGGRDKEMAACLHVEGTWLSLKSADGTRWVVTGEARRLSGSFAGGTDMLIRMSRYVLADDKATVPASAGAAWMREIGRLGKLDGTIGGMAAVEFTGDPQPYLFVACDKGDRLFRAKARDEAFEDVTARSNLQSRSRQFAWIDLDGDGWVDLVSWDGSAITACLRTRDGTFKAPDKALEFRSPCLGLAACSSPSDGSAGILISPSDLPVLLGRAAAGGWTTTKLPGGDAIREAGSARMACIVADLDNDGYWDVLQPREKAGLLWKGKAGGWTQPVRCEAACDGEPGCFALGDFNQDGFLDIFLGNSKENELWENDGKGGFRPVIQHAGSLGYKSAPGLSCCLAADLNHDGRCDLGLLAPQGAFTYHFNRGFRCFGEQGDLRLAAPEGGGEAPAGQVACAAADFNGDGSLDLAVAFSDGNVVCYYNDSFSKPTLRVGLRPPAAGPVTVSVWQGERFPLCTGASPVHAAGQKVRFCLRDTGECTVRWRAAGRPERSRRIHLPERWPDGGIEVLLEP